MSFTNRKIMNNKMKKKINKISKKIINKTMKKKICKPIKKKMSNQLNKKIRLQKNNKIYQFHKLNYQLKNINIYVFQKEIVVSFSFNKFYVNVYNQKFVNNLKAKIKKHELIYLMKSTKKDKLECIKNSVQKKLYAS